MLILPIKKKWFNMILSGEKTEEYREIMAKWADYFYSLDGIVAYFMGDLHLLLGVVLIFGPADRSGVRNPERSIMS